MAAAGGGLDQERGQVARVWLGRDTSVGLACVDGRDERSVGNELRALFVPCGVI
jgi:hypothetical protein